MSINLKTLISKLNDTSRTAATRAASICVGLGQYEVDIEHLFLALLEQPKSDFVLIARQCGISTTSLEADLRNEVSRFKTGNARTPVFSAHLPKLFEHAWLIASLDIQAGKEQKIRSSHLLLALLTEPDLAQLAYRGSKFFVKFKLDDLKHNLAKLTAGSQESEGVESTSGGNQTEDGGDPVGELTERAISNTPSLDQFTTNLTQRARWQSGPRDRPRYGDSPGD